MKRLDYSSSSDGTQMKRFDDAGSVVNMSTGTELNRGGLSSSMLTSGNDETVFKRVDGSAGGGTMNTIVTGTSFVRLGSDLAWDEDYPTNIASPKIKEKSKKP